MVRLDRIYTRAGDDGSTGLGDGSRVSKAHPRVEATGSLDELNSVLGLCVERAGTELQALLRGLQQDLFDLGAELCRPGPPARQGAGQRVDLARVARLEAWIDEVCEGLDPLDSFVLPGGPGAGAFLHLARAVCRRAERRLRALAEDEPVRPEAEAYLNRLSDLLFALARQAAGGDEVLWAPGRERS